ncbi:hypothetical protein [Streptomyces sp. NPDC007083]|uniref:hypothetical protein n=1 Tax=Streptomyces sp. NPDC007083 TaxID=3156913 RepID=UPI0033FFD388
MTIPTEQLSLIASNQSAVRTVNAAILDHASKALVIDGITRLKLHCEADQDVLDLIREMMSMPVTLILVGVGIPPPGCCGTAGATPTPSSGPSHRSGTGAAAPTPMPPPSMNDASS